MGKTNGELIGNERHIQAFHEYIIGKTIVKDEDAGTYDPKDEDKPFLFDYKSGNFHLLPNRDCSNLIRDTAVLREELVTKLSERIKGGYSLDKGVGSGGYLNPKPGGYLRPTNYFRCIEIKRGEVPYYLIFNRFYVDIQNKNGIKRRYINSILDKLQYSKGYDGENYIYYPESSEDGEYKMGITSNYSDPIVHSYYNPRVSIRTRADIITEDFLKFVEAGGDPEKMNNSGV